MRFTIHFSSRVLFQHTSWSRCFLSAPFLSKLGLRWPRPRITASPLPLQKRGHSFSWIAVLQERALQFASSRTCGIAQYMSCTGLADFKLQIYSLVLLFLETFFGLNSGSFRLSQIILLLASKHMVSLCPLSSVVALPGLSCSNSFEFVHLCKMKVG